ncbi:RNase H domain-containing protein [Trichonephila clavipes]|nr:RNase H domain-containing protein [Trichonephila clavipes]
MLNSQPLEIEKHPRYLGFILDPEILSNRHSEHLALRAGKCIKILKYITSRDWDADAGTLRSTYVFLIRSILEYDFPIFCCSSDSNLQKLKRVQITAARIITPLRNSYPKDIVLYEADMQPLILRRNACFVKYYSKLSGIGFFLTSVWRSLAEVCPLRPLKFKFQFNPVLAFRIVHRNSLGHRVVTRGSNEAVPLNTLFLATFLLVL